MTETLSRTTNEAPTEHTTAHAALRFLRALATDMSGQALRLPSYPEATIRVHRILADPNAGPPTLARAIGIEPMLAARVLALANSAAMNRTGQPVTDLSAAIMAMGFDAVRSAAHSFAMAQLREASAYRDIHAELAALWRQSVNVAATSCVLARQLRKFPPDTVMFAGLVSGVGKVYLLSRRREYPELLANPAEFASICEQWHPQIARSVLENWDIVPEIVESVADLAEAALDPRTKPMMSDIITSAYLIDAAGSAEDTLTALLSENRGAARLGLTAPSCLKLLSESKREIGSLRDALMH